MSREPSAEEAIEDQLEKGEPLRVPHVTPPLVEAYITPLLFPAVRRVPSAEEAMVNQAWIGALVCVQVVPPSVEVKMGPPPPTPMTAAASRVPSADEAIERQALVGAPVGVQVVPLLVEV